MKIIRCQYPGCNNHGMLSKYFDRYLCRECYEFACVVRYLFLSGNINEVKEDDSFVFKEYKSMSKVPWK